MSAATWWLAWLACSGSTASDSATDDGRRPSSDTAGTADTAGPTTSMPEVVSASCALSADNALVAFCDVELAVAGPMSLGFAAPGAPSRTFSSLDDSLQHRVVAWGLLPQTAYEWTAGALTGSVTTGALPEALDSFTVDVSGELQGMDAVLQPLDCQPTMMLMIDGQGRIIWYGETIYGSQMHGYDWSHDDRSVLATSTTVFHETHVSGERLLELVRGVHFDEGLLHHDVARWRGLTFLLFEYPLGSVNVDGVHAFDGKTLLGTFDLADHYTVEGTQGDWSHANGLEVTEDGELVLSLLRFDNVLGIGGDPAVSDFLDLRWVVAGSDRSLPDPDYTTEAQLAGFVGQHNASRHGDDLYLFDNRGLGVLSRGLHLRMDHAKGTMDFVAQYPTAGLCQVQGGAIPVDGGVLVTCATSTRVFYFEEGVDEPAWQMQASCGGPTRTMARAIPITVW